MAVTKRTILIVGGAFHTPASYEKLTIALEGAGFEVHVPRLPSCSEMRPPNADLTSDTALIRSYAESLIRAGRTVIAIGHSYGGQVCSNALHGLGTEARAAKGLSGGILDLVYLVGFALPAGLSTGGKSRQFRKAEDINLVFDIAEDETAVVRNPRKSFGLEDAGLDEAEVGAYVGTLCRWNGQAMFQPLEHEAWREIPVTYIHTTMDLSIPTPVQLSMTEDLERAGVRLRKFTVESGHCPHLTATQEILNCINALVLG